MLRAGGLCQQWLEEGEQGLGLVMSDFTFEGLLQRVSDGGRGLVRVGFLGGCMGMGGVGCAWLRTAAAAAVKMCTTMDGCNELCVPNVPSFSCIAWDASAHCRRTCRGVLCQNMT